MDVRKAVRDWVEHPTVSTRAFKAFLGTVLALAVIVPLALVAVPYIDFFNDMAVQYKVKSQMTWKVVDGTPVSADFAEPDGTLPQGVYPYPFPLVPVADAAEERKREAALSALAGAALDAGGPSIAPPYHRPAPTLPMIQRGKHLFDNTCITCHGPYGMGDGAVPQKGFPTPPSLLAAAERGYPDGRLFHVMTVGQNGVMPSYADHFVPADRWAIVFYVRSLEAAFPVEKEPPAGGAGGASGPSAAAPGPATAAVGGRPAEVDDLTVGVVGGAAGAAPGAAAPASAAGRPAGRASVEDLTVRPVPEMGTVRPAREAP